MLVIQQLQNFAIYPHFFNMPEDPVIIGPLVFKKNVPLIIANRIRSELDNDFGSLDRFRVTEHSLTHGRLTRQLEKVENFQGWIEKYEFLNLIVLNCFRNQIPTLSFLKIFHLPKLDSLNLSDCNVEDLQGLAKCYFPQLSSLKLYSNRIRSVKSLRKIHCPFLSELIIDSNYIQEISSLSQLSAIFLTNLQLHNNEMVTGRSILKANFPRLSEIKLESPTHSISSEFKIIGQEMVGKKYNGLQ